MMSSGRNFKEIMQKRRLELLAPAANAEIAIEALKHGADAVYMGATSHGARKSAANSIADISQVVNYAHKFRAKVYVTVNTIVYEDEFVEVERLCWKLYRIGVDALIIQDMALLRLNLPPIALHASTQCDIRTVAKARFLEDVGMSQLVLARELTLREIKEIVEAVDIPVECFIHGALCVSYSGRCHISCATTGRSANRGECSQLCRLPYTLKDGNGNVLARDKHLLSLKDFNASQKLEDLVKIGVSSFKIEGRLKEKDYVKNIVTYYRSLLDKIISANSELYERSSYGRSEVKFTAVPDKSFNRGFTDYFLGSRRPEGLASLHTPKSLGEEIKDVKDLHNGDGISFFDKDGNYQGVNVNRVEGNKILPGRKVDIPKNVVIHRTFDVEWQKKLDRETAKRFIWIDIDIDATGICACDERGVEIRLPLDVTTDVARRPMDYKDEFSKLGNTIYRLRNYVSRLDSTVFIPRSEIADLRRRMVESLDRANYATYKYDYRRKEKPEARFPYRNLDFRDNVANSLAEKFYIDHGVNKVERAMETSGRKPGAGTVVMTTRHCVLRELGLCKRLAGRHIAEPLTMATGNRTYRLHFNCADCEMEVVL